MVKKKEQSKKTEKKEKAAEAKPARPIYKEKWFFVCAALAVLLAVSVITGGFRSFPFSQGSQFATDGSSNTNPQSQASGAGQQGAQGVVDGDYVMGSLDAQVTIIEYGDYECTYCKKFHDATFQYIKTNYIEKGLVNYIYRDFPLDKHVNSQKAAEASECAGEQGKFWEMHDKLFENQGNLSIDSISTIAAELSLGQEAFKNCMYSDRYAVEVINDGIGGQKGGVASTPTFFINGQKIVGAQPFTIFSQLIDSLLMEKLGQPQGVGNNTEGYTQRVQVAVDDDPTLGNPNASITIVEFSDFQCSHCADSNIYVRQAIKRDYVDKGTAKIVFKDFPLEMNEYSQKAAEAAECAHEQGKFWEMHDKLFANYEKLALTDLKQYAIDLGLNAGQFDSCLDAGKYAGEVAKDKQDGQSYGVGGTPTFFINGIIIVGQRSYFKFKQIIEDELTRLGEKNGES